MAPGSRTYFLVGRGEPGLSCDGEGVALGGIPVAWRGEDGEGFSRWQVRSTEVHVADAGAFQVSWDDKGNINLKDAKGAIIKVPATTQGEVQSFNATTGRALGVTVLTFPGTPLGSPDGPPTPEERQRLNEERAAFEAGRLTSEQSWSGRLTTGAVLVATGLPFLALAPAAAEAPVVGPLNAVEDQWPTTNEVGVGAGRATAQARPYEASVRAPYPITEL